MAEMTVPLVDRGNGLWGSPSPAWNHLINRESSGRPYVIQEIRDVNSGGNEAEGLFQITPKTWDRHGGRDFAPSARHATPQQQAIVAARIFTRNPTGSDWGAGRPGREDPRELAAGLVPVSGTPPPPPATYGVPRGSNITYGAKGFPQWVYDLAARFNLKASTYPGHQESSRNEAGFAPNPQGLNRGIDWSGSVADMQRFADYCMSIRTHLEQVIWQNPNTGQRAGVAGGQDVTNSGYYAGDYGGHRDHVHTRQSKPIPLPGGAPAPAPVARPDFREVDMMTGGGRSNRSRPPINWLLHTEEGNSSAEQLARYCDGSHDVSYHYTLRDRVLVDVVDTDFASWSVLSANAFTINLCFAGSRAAMSRQEWLAREADIEIAAYIAVQDARKYGFSTEVLPPQPGKQGRDVYAGNPRPGISDHNYVTRELGIGDHTDVGPNFPWDVFTRYVTKYANPGTTTPAPIGDDELSAEAERLIREMSAKVNRLDAEWSASKQGPSRAFLAENGNPIESPLGFLYNIDGNLWDVKLTLGYLFHVPLAIEVVEHVAETGCYPTSWAGSQPWLNEFGQAYCQGLVGFKKKLVGKLTTATVSGGSVDVGAIVSEMTAAINQRPVNNATVDTAEFSRLHEENARLREELARTQAQPVLASIEPASATPARTDGYLAGSVVDSVQEWTSRLMTMGAEERGALATSLKALQPPTNGNQS